MMRITGEPWTLPWICRKLKLSQRIAKSCETTEPAFKEFVYELLKSEVESRMANSLGKRLSLAGFPVIKSLIGYKDSHIDYPNGIDMEELSKLDFIAKKQNLIMVGGIGTGKTHLAIALGVEACSRNMRVGFYTIPHLINKLVEAEDNGRLETVLAELQKLDLLIIDELGYVPVNFQGSRLLFRVISNCYERQSVLVTTNMEFSRWSSTFGDERMAEAIVDRIVHHGHLLRFRGRSHRLEEALLQRKNSISSNSN